MLYSKFIFGDFKGKSSNKKQIHPYGAFVDPLGSTPKSELDWISKLRMNQARLVSKMEDDSSLNKDFYNTIMSSRFLYGNFKNKDLKDKELHMCGVSTNPITSNQSSKTEFGWISRLRIDIALSKFAFVNSREPQQFLCFTFLKKVLYAEICVQKY